jgi:hypothetical protein
VAGSPPGSASGVLFGRCVGGGSFDSFSLAGTDGRVYIQW